MPNKGFKVYVGDLPKDASIKEVEKAFQEFEGYRSAWVASNPPGFAFVEFESARDADDAVRELDGSLICGVRARVELSNGRSRPRPWVRDGNGGRESGDRGGDRSGSGGDRGSGGGLGAGNRRGRPFNQSDKCYECGQSGHYAYDCPDRRGGGNRRNEYRRTDRRDNYREHRPRSYSR